MTNHAKLRAIYNKTKGHCHFCGDPVDYAKRGWRSGDLTGFWEVDHVIQRGKGGAISEDNCLPACTRCNRLRWHRTGKEVRELLLLGLIARDEVRKGFSLGRALLKLREQRLSKNKSRRRPEVFRARAR